MSERNYYVMCDSGCKFPAMNKEQILAAIEQAVSTGRIRNVDAGFVTRIQEQNRNSGIKLWIGTMAEYNALDTKPLNTICIITDDTIEEDLYTYIENLNTAVEALQNKDAQRCHTLFDGEIESFVSGEITVPNLSQYNVVVFETRETAIFCYKKLFYDGVNPDYSSLYTGENIGANYEKIKLYAVASGDILIRVRLRYYDDEGVLDDGQSVKIKKIIGIL